MYNAQSDGWRLCHAGVKVGRMIRLFSLSVAIFFVVTLDANPTRAQDVALATISDQKAGVPSRDDSTLRGTIWDERYYGVEFAAVPDPSVAIDPALQPKSLLAQLDRSLKVEGIGWSVGNHSLTPDQVLASLPTTGFRIVSLIAKDGQSAIRFDGPGPILYVTGYETAPSRPPPTLDDLEHGRFGDREHVLINAYIVRISGVESCKALQLCRDTK